MRYLLEAGGLEPQIFLSAEVSSSGVEGKMLIKDISSPAMRLTGRVTIQPMLPQRSLPPFSRGLGYGKPPLQTEKRPYRAFYKLKHSRIRLSVPPR